MDGNGRWAKERNLPRTAGHREGGESLRAVLRACGELGVKYLSVYAFSTENWLRPKKEVDFLMKLFSRSIEEELKDIKSEKVKINFLGRLSAFSPALRKKMERAMERTREAKGITVNIMVNYGGRAEIVDAVKEIVNEGKKNITEELVGKHLYTKGMPDPDLLIRTASEMRISNFLLWQIAYAELYITPVYWPDFREKELMKAIESYQKRTRKFGKTAEQLNAN
jgi:undecaprenyl diphosphate synthase